MHNACRQAAYRDGMHADHLVLLIHEKDNEVFAIRIGKVGV
jgi:hypothetical protein